MAGYYMIISKLNGTCLDVSRGSKEPGTKVITYKRNNGPNQLWYDHEATGTIRAKCNDLCIEIRGNQLVTNHYEAANMNQQWERQGNLIRNKMDHNTVIEILGADTLKDSATGTVGENSFNHGINQQWEFEHVGGIPPTSVATLGGAPTHADRSDEFYVVSEKNGKVLDIADVVKDKKTTLTMVVMHAKKYPPPKSQLWYTTKDGGLLYSSLNDTVFTGHGCGSLIMGPYKADKNLQWKIDGKKIVNGAGLCLDIRGDNDKEGAELCAYKYQGNHNQHWTFQTV